MERSLTLNARFVVVVGAWTTAVLLGIHLVGSYLWHQHAVDGRGLLARVHLGADSAFPTWIAAALLAMCAGCLAFITWTSRVVDPENRVHWAVLSAIFIAMSIDEVSTFHEWLGDAFTFDSGIGVLYYTWVVFGIAAVLVVGIMYIPFLFRLDGWTRNGFVLAGALYVGGALVMEMLNASLASAAGEASLRYDVQTGLEEAFEFAGAFVFLAVLFRVLESRDATVSVAALAGTDREQELADADMSS